MDCYKKIYYNHGIKGLYKGTIPTLLREGFPGGVYLCFYEYCLRSLNVNQ